MVGSVDKVDAEPRTSRKGWKWVWVAFLVIAGITPMFFNRSLANGLAMSGMLLIAWKEAFYPSPSARLRLKGIKEFYGSGQGREDHTSRWAGLFGSLLIIISLVMHYTSS